MPFNLIPSGPACNHAFTAPGLTIVSAELYTADDQNCEYTQDIRLD